MLISAPTHHADDETEDVSVAVLEIFVDAAHARMRHGTIRRPVHDDSQDDTAIVHDAFRLMEGEHD